MSFPYYRQLDLADCGPTCLKMVCKYYGRSFSSHALRVKSGINRQGVSLLGINEAAESLGFKTIAVKTDFRSLEQDAVLPCIVHWDQKHFVIVHKISATKVYVADPATGLRKYSKQEFLKGWGSIINREGRLGVALLLEPSISFFENEKEDQQKLNFLFLLRYIVKYKILVTQLLIALFATSIIQLIFPFLTQAIVDIGINTRNIGFITLVLLAQLMLFIGSLSLDFLKSWILLHINIRVNLSLLSEFLLKLTKLPISFFDSKMAGDITQRFSDHRRIQQFLTGPTINSFFLVFNFIIFSVVIAYYNRFIFGIFMLGSILYLAWISFLLKYRKHYDYRRFDLAVKGQDKLLQLINGMQEIKLNTCEATKRWEWENIQARLLRINIKVLTIEQIQRVGAFFFNDGKNILITFISAKAVIDGNMSLGEMLAVQYIIGQLNSPIQQFVGLIQSAQDASLSLERLNEIHLLEDEKRSSLHVHNFKSSDIVISNVSFRYPGGGNSLVLEDISFTIPQGKTTAIVGVSGSGKTTLLKLLLKFYETTAGDIKIGNLNLESVDVRHWRSNCGVVMQESFIFTDTILNNITISDVTPDLQKLDYAIQVANIKEFISGLPLGFNTKIGSEGLGISQGQRQRILIARAVYKDPEIILFDEATNSLDSKNEKIIMERLDTFFQNRTVVIVAHRLSTVKNADQILVFDKGRVIEVGNHKELTMAKGAYYELVSNQLELGN